MLMAKYLRTPDGHQVVVIDKRFAYAWIGKPDLELGEQVILPGKHGAGSHWNGTVTGFGSDFRGVLKVVIDRVVPVEVSPKPHMTSALAQHIADQYKRGKSIRDLAEEHGRSYGGIRSALINQKVKLRPRGGFN
jgi:hypothetical protein